MAEYIGKEVILSGIDLKCKKLLKEYNESESRSTKISLSERLSELGEMRTSISDMQSADVVVVERSKIDKAIKEISNIDWNEVVTNYDDVEIGFRDKVNEILRKNGVIE